MSSYVVFGIVDKFVAPNAFADEAALNLRIPGRFRLDLVDVISRLVSERLGDLGGFLNLSFTSLRLQHSHSLSPAMSLVISSPVSKQPGLHGVLLWPSVQICLRASHASALVSDCPIAGIRQPPIPLVPNLRRLAVFS